MLSWCELDYSIVMVNASVKCTNDQEELDAVVGYRG
jgi:hypothetical protein